MISAMKPFLVLSCGREEGAYKKKLKNLVNIFLEIFKMCSSQLKNVSRWSYKKICESVFVFFLMRQYSLVVFVFFV